MEKAIEPLPDLGGLMVPRKLMGFPFFGGDLEIRKSE